MTGINTYGALAEEIITEYYKKQRNDNAGYTLRHIAEQIAQEVALQAFDDAVLQDKLGESVYANDQFISTYFGLSMFTDGGGSKYVPLPSIPAGLPQGREIEYVGFTGNKKTQVFIMRNKDRFAQSFIKTPKWMVLAYVEDGKVVFDNLSAFVTGTVDMKLVGAIPSGSELIDLPLNIPKQTQSIIFDKLLNRMNQLRPVLPDSTNDNISK